MLYRIIIWNLRTAFSDTTIDLRINLKKEASKLINILLLLLFSKNTIDVAIYVVIFLWACWFDSDSNTFREEHQREANNKIDSVSDNPYNIEGSLQFNEAKNFVWPRLINKISYGG